MNGRYEFHESDWKLFSKKIIDWQESHMERLNKEYIALLSEDKDASERFWTLHDRILEDKNRYFGMQLIYTDSFLICVAHPYVKILKAEIQAL